MPHLSFTANGGFWPIHYLGTGGQFTRACAVWARSPWELATPSASKPYTNLPICVLREWNGGDVLVTDMYIYKQMGWIVCRSPDCLQCKTHTLASEGCISVYRVPIALRQGTVRLSKNHVLKQSFWDISSSRSERTSSPSLLWIQRQAITCTSHDPCFYAIKSWC